MSTIRVRAEAERLAAVLPPLLVQADRVAATVAQGVHGRRRVGQGETFWQFRRYQPGDPVRGIDWRQSAKSRHVFVRETEWEAAQSVWLWRDASPSMRFRSRRELPDKVDRAALLTLALAALLVRGGEQIALLGDGHWPSSGRPALNRIAITLERGDGGDGTGLPAFEMLPRHGHVAWFGDFLAPLDQTRQLIGQFAARGVSGHIVQVLDPAEAALPYRGRVRFEGLEGEAGTLIGRAEQARDEYVERMTSHQAALAQLCRAAGWSFAVHHTDRSPEAALLRLYGALAHVPLKAEA